MTVVHVTQAQNPYRQQHYNEPAMPPHQNGQLPHPSDRRGLVVVVGGEGVAS